MGTAAFLYDPVMFGDDNGEREEYNRMLRFNSRPRREPRPMYLGPDGRLRQQYNRSDPHENRMHSILRDSRKGSPHGRNGSPHGRNGSLNGRSRSPQGSNLSYSYSS